MDNTRKAICRAFDILDGLCIGHPVADEQIRSVAADLWHIMTPAERTAHDKAHGYELT